MGERDGLERSGVGVRWRWDEIGVGRAREEDWVGMRDGVGKKWSVGLRDGVWDEGGKWVK